MEAAVTIFGVSTDILSWLILLQGELLSYVVSSTIVNLFIDRVSGQVETVIEPVPSLMVFL